MTDIQIKIIKALNNGLPISEKPFDEIANQVGISTDQLLAQLLEWKADGTIRRFGAILRHNRAGYDANTLVVWDVPVDKIDSFAAVVMLIKNISHCYRRPRFQGFDYNLYTMVHGRSREDCLATIKIIKDQTGIDKYTMLDTVTEFKKSSPVYFSSCNDES